MASMIHTGATWLLRIATIAPNSPQHARWAAGVPELVASTRSNAVGEAAELQVPLHCHTGLKSDTFHNGSRNRIAHAAKLFFVGPLGIRRLDHMIVARQARDLGHPDD